VNVAARTVLAVWLLCLMASGQEPENVLVVTNARSPLSTSIAEYYTRKRNIPSANVCSIRTTSEEIIQRSVYDSEIAFPVMSCLQSRGLAEKIHYIVTTMGVPLGIDGKGGIQGDQAAVDSELTLLYALMRGRKYNLAGAIANPFFGKRDAPFTHNAYPIYLVTRLAAYNLNDVRAMIDRSLKAVNRGRVVLDMRSPDDATGDDWLRTAAILLPPGRVVLDESATVLTRQKDVIGFASWGSNDANRKVRHLRFEWLPGAIMTEYVSTNGRTFERPPDNFEFSSWSAADRLKWFKGSPQSLVGDYLAEGATGAAAHVFEPYLQFTPRPDHLFPAYLSGRTLAESFYLSIPALSWKNIVIGDPLCRLAKPQ
jgi:uncharacterized protein (TIGR03790 family)